MLSRKEDDRIGLPKRDETPVLHRGIGQMGHDDHVQLVQLVVKSREILYQTEHPGYQLADVSRLVCDFLPGDDRM